MLQIRSLARTASAVMVVSVLIFVCAQEAAAKVLPVTAVDILTKHPKVDAPVQISVRFGNGFDLGDEYVWATNEVAVLPADRTGRHGWPRDRNDRGMAVPLRRVGHGRYRGSFVVHEPGDYVVFDWSSVIARETRLEGAVVKGTYPAPIKLTISGIAPAEPAPVRTVHRAADAGDASPRVEILLIVAALIAITTGVAVRLRRARSRKTT
jgi:hypothetical protein